MIPKAEASRRLRAVEDERAIVRLLHRYCHTADDGDDFGAIFAADAVFDVRMSDGRLIHAYDGRAAIQAYMDGRDIPPDRFDKHLVSAPVVDLDGDAAAAESYFVILQSNAEHVAVSYGRYHDRLVKTDRGWRLAERTIEAEAVHSPQVLAEVAANELGNN